MGSGNRRSPALSEGGSPARFLTTDVAKYHDVERMVRATADLFGRLDFAVNNATAGDGDFIGNTETDSWDPVRLSTSLP